MDVSLFDAFATHNQSEPKLKTKLLFTPPVVSAKQSNSNPTPSLASSSAYLGTSVNLSNTWAEAIPQTDTSSSPLPFLPNPMDNTFDNTNSNPNPNGNTNSNQTIQSQGTATLPKRKLQKPPNAAQKVTGVWRYTGGSTNDSKDTPAVRSFAVQLERSFDHLMKVPNNPTTSNNDFLSIQADVDAHIAQRQLLCLCTNTTLNNNPEKFKHVDSALADALGINNSSINKVSQHTPTIHYTLFKPNATNPPPPPLPTPPPPQ